MPRKPGMRPLALPPRLQNEQLQQSSARYETFSGTAAMPMVRLNLLEWLATILWDPNGDRRRAQQRRLSRHERKMRQADAAERRAIAQIRRTQEVAAPLAELDQR